MSVVGRPDRHLLRQLAGNGGRQGGVGAKDERHRCPGPVLRNSGKTVNCRYVRYFFFSLSTQFRFQVEKLGSPLNTLSHHLSKVLAYEKGERDMLLLRHEVIN